MATPQEYVLSFDFTSFTTQFSSLNKSFTDFGDTIQKFSSQVSANLKGVQDQADQLYQTLSKLGVVSEGGFKTFERHIVDTSKYLDDYQKKSTEIAQRLKDISNTDLSKVSEALTGGAKDTPHERVEDVMPGGVEGLSGKDDKEDAEKKKTEVEGLLSKLETLDKKFEDVDKKLEEFYKKVYSVVEKEAKQAKDKAGGILSQLTGGLFAGGLVGIIFGSILLGYQEKNRKQAELGEMLNVFEAGTSDFFSKTTTKAADWFADFAEKAQFYYGIGREETQKTVKAMMDAGYTSEQTMEKFDKKLGEVGSNVGTLTLGIDKHLNMASGTAMQNVNTLVSEYGDTLNDAADKYTKLAFAAQRSGMGVSKFVDSVMSGSQALAQYGIDLNDVAHVMETLKKHYQDMGLDKQYAGGQAAEALSGISQGIAGMGIGMQVVLSKRLFPKAASALEARQKFMEGWQRVAEGSDQGFLIQAVQEAVGYAREQTGGNREEMSYFLQSQGFGFQAATAAVDIAEKLDKGANIQELDEKETKALREAFLTEGKAVSEMLKNQRHLIDGMSELGQGLLKILSGLLGTLITGFKWLVSLPSRLKMKPKEHEEKGKIIDAAFEAQFASIGSGLDMVATGFEKTMKGTGNIFKDLFGSTKVALDADFEGANALKESMRNLRKEMHVQMSKVSVGYLVMKADIDVMKATISKFFGSEGSVKEAAERRERIRANAPAYAKSLEESIRWGRVMLSKKGKPDSVKSTSKISAKLIAGANTAVENKEVN